MINRFRFIAIFGFILLGVLSRFLPHPPNFTAMNSIALFGAFTIGNLGMSFFTVLATMALSDLTIGFHPSMPFVYLSFGLIVLMGYWLKSKKFITQIPLFLTASSLLFFVVSNFGVWFTYSFYPKTCAGLGACYLAAIPFLTNQIFGDLIYGITLFGMFALAEKFIPAIRTNNENVMQLS